jgi:hypothetical protein
LPGGRIIYTDTNGWGKVEKPLFYTAMELTGKPDYLVEQKRKIIGGVKSGRAPDSPLIRIFINLRRIVCWWKRPIRHALPMGSFIMKTVILQ